MFSMNNITEIKNNDTFTEYGECRCCMAKGLHRDVTKEYFYNNIKEIYKDIFMECFNYSLSICSHISSLICSNCVQRLRDATSFRMMAVTTEKQLLNTVICKSETDIGTEFVNGPTSIIQNFTTDIKVEFVSENFDTEPDIFHDGSREINSKVYKEKSDGAKKHSSEEFDDEEEYYDDCDSTYSASTKDDEPVEVIEGESKLLARFPRSVQPLPKRSELAKICPEYDEHLKRLEDKIVQAKSIEWFLKKPEKNDSKFMSEKIALAVNTTALFEHSNATAFKTKMRHGYPCFYCREIYNFDTLRTHQTIHPKASICKLLTKYTADEFIVYADITDLKCTICNENMNNLTELKTHLYGKHEKNMYADCPDRVIPFKLKEMDLECQICGRQFETFGAVERHMNTHYRNFICEECGAGFITKHRLAVHTYTRHKHDRVPCNVCKKDFSSQMKYRIHYDSVHRMLKKYKCPKCSEKFIDYFTRQKHLVDVHCQEPILYKCNVCNKGFNRKFGLSAHVKRCHLEQRDVKCQLCSYMCYTKTELKDHMVKHSGARPFECYICKKGYSRNKALLLHMRIHNNDRRYTCAVCGLAFVQRSTLKGHMKTHEEHSALSR